MLVFQGGMCGWIRAAHDKLKVVPRLCGITMLRVELPKFEMRVINDPVIQLCLLAVTQKPE